MVKAMPLDKNTRLADLMYGHNGEFHCHLSGRFDPDKYTRSPPIQICEMECGCWIVADGNNRVGLILRRNPEATLADIPGRLLVFTGIGEWDDDTMGWWNPSPKSFRDVMRKRPKTRTDHGIVVHGMIERCDDGSFFACVVGGKANSSISARGATANDAKAALEGRVASELGTTNLVLVLTSMNALEDHQCISHDGYSTWKHQSPVVANAES